MTILTIALFLISFILFVFPSVYWYGYSIRRAGSASTYEKKRRLKLMFIICIPLSMLVLGVALLITYLV